MARYSEAHNKATQRYIKKAYDEVKIRMPKGKKDEIKAFVEECNYPSMNQFIIDAVEHYTKAVQEEQERLAKLDEAIMKKREGQE